MRFPRQNLELGPIKALPLHLDIMAPTQAVELTHIVVQRLRDEQSCKVFVVDLNCLIAVVDQVVALPTICLSVAKEVVATPHIVIYLLPINATVHPWEPQLLTELCGLEAWVPLNHNKLCAKASQRSPKSIYHAEALIPSIVTY